ncbi:MAG: DNA-binding response regulator [Sphingomonas sp. 67-36]|uniref:response regulator transcription factor n=2 Tax=unclassified Sphingomonas TaxID=196159 RepID=UPI0009264B79|nr:MULTISPECIES: response regulator transcription factor [unclassified Sphingomonas]MBN8849427.1 response regulator transcription factor [Sphingomonas sp.]OJV28877.1 MAG: DNA-binding response regulator [Sphingomonas sp. 67-36]
MNLLLVEDDEGYAATLAEELRALDHQVTIAPTGGAALQIADREPFDAAIIDRLLPQMDGTAVLRRLRESGKMLPVVMLSALGRSAEKVEGLEAGADDYVVKPTPAAELDARLKALLRGRQWTAGGGGDTIRVRDITVSPARFRAWRGERPLDLVRLELNLLAELARNAGTVLTRAMLIERVWGYDFEPTTNIVDVQIRALRRKLMADGEDDPIVTVRGVGYMLRD